MYTRHRSRVKGYTLIEILVAVAIIGMLVGISVPIVLRQIDKGKESTARTQMRDLVAATEMYYDDYQIMPIHNYSKDDDNALYVHTTNSNDDKDFYLSSLTGISDGHNNLNQKVYIAFQEKYILRNAAGEIKKLYDPWMSKGYQIGMNQNKTGSVDWSTYYGGKLPWKNQVFPGDVSAFCRGKDGVWNKNSFNVHNVPPDNYK